MEKTAYMQEESKQTVELKIDSVHCVLRNIPFSRAILLKSWIDWLDSCAITVNHVHMQLNQTLSYLIS